MFYRLSEEYIKAFLLRGTNFDEKMELSLEQGLWKLTAIIIFGQIYWPAQRKTSAELNDSKDIIEKKTLMVNGGLKWVIFLLNQWESDCGLLLIASSVRITTILGSNRSVKFLWKKLFCLTVLKTNRDSKHLKEHEKVRNERKWGALTSIMRFAAVATLDWQNIYSFSKRPHHLSCTNKFACWFYLNWGDPWTIAHRRGKVVVFVYYGIFRS